MPKDSYKIYFIIQCIPGPILILGLPNAQPNSILPTIELAGATSSVGWEMTL